MKYKILLLALFFTTLPLTASAAVSLFPFGYWGPLVSCMGINCNTCHLFSTAQMIIYFGMTMVLFVFAPIMITIGGIMMLISGGNEEKFGGGKKMATGAIVGILITLVAFLIVNTLLFTIARNFNGFESGTGFTISCTANSPYVAPRYVPQNQQNNNSSLPSGTTCPEGSYWIAADGRCEYGDNSPAVPILQNGMECPEGSYWIATNGRCEYGDGSTGTPVQNIPTGGSNDTTPI